MASVDHRRQLISVGIYTFAEASRISKRSQGRIRRSMPGYTYRRGDNLRRSPPVIQSSEAIVSRSVELTFRDLIEILCVHDCLTAGTSWPVLREAREKAAAMLKVPHHFAARNLPTDGHSILAKVGNRTIVDLVKNQFAFSRTIGSYLQTDGTDFSGEFPTNWWPLGRLKPIVIDSGRSFGQPIVAKEGVPTMVLRDVIAPKPVRVRKIPNSTTSGDESVDVRAARTVEEWYEVDRSAVPAAIEDEMRLAA
jgi:hypothetical protein